MSLSLFGIFVFLQDDFSLFVFFVCMQFFRVLLDFFLMWFFVFEIRVEKLFFIVCEELEMCRVGFDGSYKKLEKDVEFFCKEFGEDCWVIVFCGVGC